MTDLAPSTVSTSPIAHQQQQQHLQEEQQQTLREDPLHEIERLRKEVRVLRQVCKDHPQLYEDYYHHEAVDTLKKSLFFNEVEDVYLHEIAKLMQRVVYEAGTLIQEEDSPWDRPAMFVAHGTVSRWSERDGIFVRVRSLDPHSMGAFHLLIDEPTRFNVRTETEVIAYELQVADFRKLLDSYPQIMLPVARALAKKIRAEDIRYETTALLEQRGTVPSKERKTKTIYTATALAATFESFYRSAMNNFINSQIAGRPLGPMRSWFPAMHIQIPTRVVYISGLKEFRRILGEIETRDRLIPQSLLQMLLSFAPGVIMCPLSSILEATHAHGNAEPMKTRWTRGFAPRLVREVVFGIGLNQLSDYCREQVPASIQNQHIRTALGSIASGVLSGYLSQIPHNLSTMKLLEPQKTYGELWSQLARASEQRVPVIVPESAKSVVANVLALTVPLGCLRRSLQIGGSFIVLNGLIYSWRNNNWY